jgi:hypothetical protein
LNGNLREQKVVGRDESWLKHAEGIWVSVFPKTLLEDSRRAFKHSPKKF